MANAIKSSFSKAFEDLEWASALRKDITVEDHISHAGGHLGRTARHIAAVKEHHAEIGNYAGFAKSDGSDQKHNPHIVNHLMKAANNIGRAHEQQTMAVRHTNALTGNEKYGNDELYRKGDKATQEVGGHLARAQEHLESLGHHATVPAGETDQGKADRTVLAAHHHAKAGEHLDAALEKVDDAKSAFDASLEPERAQQENNPRGVGQDPVQNVAKPELTLANKVPDHLLSINKTESGDFYVRLFAPIMEMKKGEITGADNETKIPGLIVKGWASVAEYKDKQGDIIDAAALRKAAEDWSAWGKSNGGKGGNIREMHEPKACGIAPVIEIRPHPLTKTDALWIECFIVGDEAIKKCLAGVYRAFSIGGKCESRVPEKEAA
jgi:hypothetical protein